MFAFIERLLPKKDPEAVDTKLVRRYLKMNRRFDRLYASGSFEDFRRARELFHELSDMRAGANCATVGAINRAHGLPDDHCNSNEDNLRS